MEPVTFTPIGVIRTPYAETAGMPIQAAGAAGVGGAVELDPAYAAGLRDIEGFSHLILLYHLHLSREPALEVIPFLDTVAHGVFATRAPKRPNALGLTVVRLLAVEGATLRVEGADVVDGTPPQVSKRAVQFTRCKFSPQMQGMQLRFSGSMHCVRQCVRPQLTVSTRQ